MQTKLSRFRVQNFRSIEASDWIDVSDNSCLVGTNEAGKTNLLLALWKLNPANDEPIVPLNDFPRGIYSNYKSQKHANDIFVSADFNLNEKFAGQIATELSCDIEQIKTVLVERIYGGNHYVSFPYTKIDKFPSTRIVQLINAFKAKLEADDVFIKEEEGLRNLISLTLVNILDEIIADYSVKTDVVNIITKIKTLSTDNFGKKVNLPDFFKIHLLNKLDFFLKAFEGVPIQAKM